MDLETFLALEKQNLMSERERLSARSVANLQSNTMESNLQQQSYKIADGAVECMASRILQNKENVGKIKCNRNLNCEKGVNNDESATNNHMPCEKVKEPPPTAVNELPKAITNAISSQKVSSMNGADVGVQLSKTYKDLANHKELSAVANKNENVSEGARKSNMKKKKKDDMEQWVSDTFYSYFPGFNNEYQKRQSYLRDRQLENQQNLLKHQMSHPLPVRHAALKTQNSIANATYQNVSTTARSSATNSSTDKTDLEIIVNNPNYVPTKLSTQPESSRHKLLQDLRHIELSNIITGDGVMERNRHSAEIELARKKDYQRELMQQIEEKRRSIEVLREKERQQEEVLTKRLQDQLKTIKLEEELEKEKLKVDKLRFDTEQNRIMREHLLSKLENDNKLLYAKTNKTKFLIDRSKGAAAAEKSSGESSSSNDNNKVYKYFSNSARHEYRRGKPLPADVDLHIEIPEITSTRNSNTERECFHLSEKVCPMCNVPLKSYESCCLRCQRKLSIKMRHSSPQKEAEEGGEGNEADVDDVPCHAYSLVCSKCERLYALCPTCLAKSDVCRACHRQRNVCMNCRRTLCSFCLEEIACGRDAERSHVSEEQNVTANKESANKNESVGSERSFKVLDVNFASDKLSNDNVAKADKTANYPPNNVNYINRNNNAQSNRLPYSINIERNSIFHPNYEPSKQTSGSLDQLPKIIDKNLSFDLDSSGHTDENSNIERVRRETDKRLSRFLKNYGDLAKYTTERSQSESRDRSTQTTPLGSARRDVVLHEEHNLSMPLLREMPKMTRSETIQHMERSQRQTNTRLIKNLSRRWEIPAVQKFMISPTSPPVLTQVGAIRKQLQAERLLSDDY